MLRSSSKQLLWRQAGIGCVLSTGRCGTMTVARLLQLSSSFTASHEDVTFGLRAFQTPCMEAGLRGKQWQKAVLKEQLGANWTKAYLSGKRWCSASHFLTFFAPALAELSRDARFLHLVRDPYEVIRSAVSRGWYNDHPSDVYRPRPPHNDPSHQDWPRWGSLEKNCWYWARVNRFALRLREEIGGERVLLLKSEDLFRADGATAATMISFFGGTLPNTSSIVEVLSEKHNAQPPCSLNCVQPWNSKQIATIGDILGETADSLGYDLAPR